MNAQKLFPYEARRFLYRILHKTHYRRQIATLIDSPIEPNAYSLRPYHKTKSIFIHIPKCAGISITHSLYGSLGSGHMKARTLQLYFTKQEFNSFYKFTFCRNPWDRLFSAYHFLKAGGITDEDKRFRNKYLISSNSFEKFVLQLLDNPMILNYYHFLPQINYITGYDGKIVVDHIGKLEEIEHDFNVIKEYVNPQASLKHMNKTSSQKTDTNYKKHYNTKMIDKVHDVYKKDINLLGYQF